VSRFLLGSLELAGVITAHVGLWQIYPPAAIVAAGLTAVGYSVLLGRTS
jgi:hypothetical protein